jgi:hypothetical protein
MSSCNVLLLLLRWCCFPCGCANSWLQFFKEYDKCLNKYMGMGDDGIGLDLTLVRHIALMQHKGRQAGRQAGTTHANSCQAHSARSPAGRQACWLAKPACSLPSM